MKNTLFFIALLFLAQSASARCSSNTIEEDSIQLRLHELYTTFVDMEIRENYDSAYSIIKQCYDIDSTQAEIIYQHAVYDHMFLPKDSVELHIPEITAEVEKAYSKDKKNKKYAKTLLSLYAAENDTAKVCSILEALTELDRTNEQYVSMLINIYDTMGEYDKQLAAIDRLEQMVGASKQTELTRVTALWHKSGERKAIQYWEKLRAKNPKDPAYQIYMGKMLMRQNAPYTAAVHFKKALKLDPANDEVKYLYITCMELHGKEKKAHKMKLDIVNDPAASADLKVQLIRDLQEEYEAMPNGTQLIAGLFQTALSTPQETDDLTILYYEYLQLQKCSKDSIANAMSQLLQTEPGNDMARQLLMAYYAERDSTDALIALCQTAVDNNTDKLEFHYYLGICHYEKKEYEKAKQALLRAVANRQFASNTELYSQCYSVLGQIYHTQDSLQKCYEMYEECLKWTPDDDATLNNYAYYISIDENGDLEKAEKMSRKAINAYPDRGTYLDTYAWILFKQKRYPEALKYINKALNDHSSTGGVVYEHAGDIYACNGDIDAAMAYWELAKDQDEVSDKLTQKLEQRKYIP